MTDSLIMKNSEALATTRWDGMILAWKSQHLKSLPSIHPYCSSCGWQSSPKTAPQLREMLVGAIDGEGLEIASRKGASRSRSFIPISGFSVLQPLVKPVGTCLGSEDPWFDSGTKLAMEKNQLPIPIAHMNLISPSISQKELRIK
jgi:hypothetical protein